MHPNLYNLQPCIFARRISSSMIDGQSPRSHPYRSNHGPAISPHRRAPPLETEVACCIGYCRHAGDRLCFCLVPPKFNGETEQEETKK